MYEVLLFIGIENCRTGPKIDEREEKGESGWQVSSAAVLHKEFYLSPQRRARCGVSIVPHPRTYLVLSVKTRVQLL